LSDGFILSPKTLEILAINYHFNLLNNESEKLEIEN
jgi:hypothetical protein